MEYRKSLIKQLESIRLSEDILTKEGFYIQVYYRKGYYSLIKETMKLELHEVVRILSQPQHIIYNICFLLLRCKVQYEKISEVISFAFKIR